MSNIHHRVLRTPRFAMDSTAEPQKRISRTRKTMKAIDRQQSEAVYKVKEDTLNSTKVKLLKGKHKNGDSDASLNDTDCIRDKHELNGMLASLGPNIGYMGSKEVPDASPSDAMDSRKGNQNIDLHSKLGRLPTKQLICKPEDTLNTSSMELGDQGLDQNKDVHFNAENGINMEGLDQRENKGFSLCGRERRFKKDIIEKQMDKSGSVNVFLSDQPVEEMVLRKQAEGTGVAENLLEDELGKVQPDDLMKDQLESLEEQPLQELLQDGDKVAHDSRLLKKGVVPQQKELLKGKTENQLAVELPKSTAILSKPQGHLEPSEAIDMAVAEEAQLEEAMIEKTQMKGMLKDEKKQQELVDRPEHEMVPAKWPQLKVALTREPLLGAGLVEDPKSEEELTDDQLLEELAEEQQFGEDLADDHLLDELMEDQRPEDVLEKMEAPNSLVEVGQEVGEEEKVEVEVKEVDEEKLEMPDKTEEKFAVEEEHPEVTVENHDLELEAELVVENKQIKKQVAFQLVAEKQKAKEDLKQKSEEDQKLTEDKAEQMECSWDMEKVEKMEEESKMSEENSLVDNAGELAISIRMDIDQDSKVDKTTHLPEAAIQNPLVDMQNNGCDLENSDSVQTDDIIPILEKLAPVKEGLNSLSQPHMLSEGHLSMQLVDKVQLSQASSSKQEHSENLSSEAFLVLTDKEDVCIVDIPGSEEQLKQSSPTGEASQRKRSKSEEMDGMQSKRRRYKGEEAELQVKITTRADVDRKLQKVIQRLLEEKLCAMQCADFDKALVDLTTRVEKIECKKHESVLNGIQVKIGRLLKRFGAAKEDMKKRRENEEVQLVQPDQPGSQSKATSDGANISLANRNFSTVQQILETKKNVDTPATPFQTPTSAGPPPLITQQRPQPATSNQSLQRVAQTSSSQSPVPGSTPARPMPDWNLIQRRINASQITSPKSQTPVTSAQAMTPVISSPTTAPIVGANQLSSTNGQPMSVSLQSLQSLPMILHLPVMPNNMQNGSVMQSTTGRLVTNKQSGKMEFIPTQNRANLGNLQKQTVILASTITPKLNNSMSSPSPVMQWNTQASASSSGPMHSVHAVSSSVTQAPRTSISTISTSGQNTTINNRSPMKVPISSFTSPTSSKTTATPRAENQLNRMPITGAAGTKRSAEVTTQSGKAGGGGFIDLTEDDDGSLYQGAQKPKQINISGISQPPQLRPSQPLQAASMQLNTMPPGLTSQTTIQVLPTAHTTVNVNHRSMTQAMPRLSTPRNPTSHQVVYTTPPSALIQSPVRNAIMQSQNQGFRQISPQTGGKNHVTVNGYIPDPRHHPLSDLAGVTVRMPQSTAYMVNNGSSVRSGGSQMAVQHRPPQVPDRLIHPAPLPEAPQPQHLPPEASRTSPPQKPDLKLTRVQSQNGIVLSWNVLDVDCSCAKVDSYHLYAYHEDPTATIHSQWKKVGEVKALPLPMACTLTQFISGSKYYFAVRAKDVYGRFGVFCDPQSTDVIATQIS